MKILRKLLLIFYDLIDEFYHQKRIEKFIKNNQLKLENFVDVGSFKGKYTDLILKIEQKCKVIMIEPQRKYYELLKDKYKNDRRVEIFNIGISDKKANLNLKINKHEITSTFSNFKDTSKYLNLKAILFESNLKNMTQSEESVKVFQLDEILKDKNFQHLDLLKIDTEGHEYEVLYGTMNYLKKIKYILIEIHINKIYENYDSEKIHNFLLENNFSLLKTFNFPFTTWHDRLYKNSKF